MPFVGDDGLLENGVVLFECLLRFTRFLAVWCQLLSAVANPSLLKTVGLMVEPICNIRQKQKYEISC
jgi:hypothetical protein